jgi:hypothetical protein
MSYEKTVGMPVSGSTVRAISSTPSLGATLFRSAIPARTKSST